MYGTNESPEDERVRVKAAKAYVKANRPWFKKKRSWILVLIAFWILFLIAIGITSQPMGGIGSSAGSIEVLDEVTTSANAVKVTAEKLLSDLEVNALAAKNTWDNKLVTVTGKLINIDASGKYFYLEGTDEEFRFTGIRINTDKSFIEVVSAFNNGQTLTVTGKITGVGEFLGYRIDAKSIP